MALKPAHVIFLEWPLGRNSGGPAGYLWHLRHGLELAGFMPQVEFITGKTAVAAPPTFMGKVKKIVGAAIAGIPDPIRRILKTHGPSEIGREYALLMTKEVGDYFAVAEWEAILADKDYSSFHCHTTLDCLKVHNSLNRLGRRKDVTLYLTSHCPEMPALEMTDMMRERGLTPAAAKRTTKKLLAIDMAAFACADRLIFPCAEALEPYLETCPPIEAIFKSKKILYLLTGIEAPVCGRPFSFPSQSEGRFRMAYVGRHNKVKGYDQLCRVIPLLLDRLRATLFIAGKQGPLFAPVHPHWHEFGWITNAQDVIAKSDLFLLPNARTYFDLIALEVMSLGVPVLASATGGNKKLAALTPGVILFDGTDEGLQGGLEHFQSLEGGKRAELGAANRSAYEQYFTPRKFAENYIALIMETPAQSRQAS